MKKLILAIFWLSQIIIGQEAIVWDSNYKLVSSDQQFKIFYQIVKNSLYSRSYNELSKKLSPYYGNDDNKIFDARDYVIEKAYYRFILLGRNINFGLIQECMNYISPCSEGKRNVYYENLKNKNISKNSMAAISRIICNEAFTKDLVYGPFLNERDWPDDFRKISQEERSLIWKKLTSDELKMLFNKLKNAIKDSYVNMGGKAADLEKEIEVLDDDVYGYIFEHLYYRFIRPKRPVDLQALYGLIMRIKHCSYTKRQEFYQKLKNKNIDLKDISASGRIRCDIHYISDWWK